EVGMAAEPDPEHVVDLALVPIGRGPDPRDRVDLGLGPGPDAQAQARPALERAELVRDAEASGLVHEVGAGEVREEAEEERRPGHEARDLDQPLWRYFDCQLAAVLDL